jgi:exonuclease SbcC
MIKRIELTNFMSHEHTVIEPASGLTVLVGPNNCGKSAVVAALQILCHNENSTYVLRHGEKECSVKVETDDGHTVEWRRKNSPSYVIDGVSFDRLGRGAVPDELHPVLRMPLVDASGDADFDVHFGIQKSPIFLLGSSSANAAKFFASSSDAIQLVQIQKRHKDKLAEKQRQKNQLDAESKQLNSELECLQEVADLERRIVSSEQLQQEVGQLAMRIDDVEKAQSVLAEQHLDVRRHQDQCHSLAALAKPPELSLIEPLLQTIAPLSAAQALAAQSASFAEVLSALSSPPASFDVDSLAAAVNGLVTHQQRIAANQELLQKLDPLPPNPAIADVVPLQNTIAHLDSDQWLISRDQERYTTLAEIHQPPSLGDESALSVSIAKLAEATGYTAQWTQAIAAMSDLNGPPATHETVQISKLLEELKTATTQSADSRATLAEADAELSAAIASIREMAQDAVCPTCGGPFDADRLLAGAIVGSRGHDHA